MEKTKPSKKNMRTTKNIKLNTQIAVDNLQRHLQRTIFIQFTIFYMTSIPQ
jgi:hypothetical protein